MNMVLDRDIDKVMHRTRHRPLVTGEVTPRAATVFAVVLEVAAFAELWAWVNLLSAVLAVAATAFYILVYTLWLKRTSTQNIVIGGAAGAVPVLVGWSAVTDHLGWAPLVLFAVIVIWTPPHFWALAIRYRDDYAAANVPMLPVVATLRQHRPADPRLHHALVAVTVLFAAVGHMGATVPGRRARARRPLHRVRAAAAARTDAQGGHGPVPVLDHLPDAALRRHGRGRPHPVPLTDADRRPGRPPTGRWSPPPLVSLASSPGSSWSPGS